MKIAIIPARSGSKRIPRKNIKIFCGLPVIAYSIKVAQESGLFDRIIVSTDDDEIAEVSRSYGAETPFMRPKSLADDYTVTRDVINHAIEWLVGQGQKIDYVCCLYATAPLLQSRYLVEGFEKLSSSNKSIAFSVTSFPFPIQRALRITPNNEVEAIWPENIKARSQDLEETYHDAGQFYWGHTKSFLKNVATFSSASVPIILPRHLVQDIDTLEDWERAELMYQLLIVDKKET
jgi:pseudaminic acid cytidylyltransferase